MPRAPIWRIPGIGGASLLALTHSERALCSLTHDLVRGPTFPIGDYIRFDSVYRAPVANIPSYRTFPVVTCA